MRKVAVFVNPLLSGKSRAQATVTAVATLLKRQGLEVTIRELGTTPEAADLARRAIADGCDTIFSCGGDGTVFALLQALAGSGIALGILPMGTGNVLAQNMRLPRNPVAAAQALLRATPRQIPLGRLSSVSGDSTESSWYFAMSAGIGAHAVLMQNAERWGKHFSGRAAYYFAGFGLLFQHEIECFEIEIATTSGETITRPASEALVVRVAELNRWRPGGNLEQPLLRLASTSANSRLNLARASLGALLSNTRQPAALPTTLNGASSHPPADPSSHSVIYHDITRLVCRPLPSHEYRTAPLLQADGEVLGASNAVITMAAETLTLLWPEVPA